MTESADNREVTARNLETEIFHSLFTESQKEKGGEHQRKAMNLSISVAEISGALLWAPAEL